jgi:uncharacterized protein (DUF924 family)
MPGIDEVLSYWLEPLPTTPEAVEAKKKFWFDGGSDVDREVRERFGAHVERARRGELDAWAETPQGTLALIVLIDQFSRNLHRGTPDAFSHDPKALRLASDGYDRGRFDGFGTIEHFFASMPFRHAEDVETQKRGVTRAVKDALGAETHLRELMIYSVDWARKHLDVIVRFGRFPHRNAALGRASTPDELEYLRYLKIAGQWL